MDESFMLQIILQYDFVSPRDTEIESLFSAVVLKYPTDTEERKLLKQLFELLMKGERVESPQVEEILEGAAHMHAPEIAWMFSSLKECLERAFWVDEEEEENFIDQEVALMAVCLETYLSYGAHLLDPWEEE